MYQHLALLPVLQTQLCFSAPSIGLWSMKFTWQAPSNIDVTTDILMHYHKFSLPEWNALCPNFVDVWRPHRFLLMKGNTISSFARSLKSCYHLQKSSATEQLKCLYFTCMKFCFLIHRKCIRTTLSDHSQCLFNKEMSPWVCLSYTEHSYYLGGRKSMRRSAGCFYVLPVAIAIIANMWLWISRIWTSNHNTRQFQACWAALQLVAYFPSKKKNGNTCCTAVALALM